MSPRRRRGRNEVHLCREGQVSKAVCFSAETNSTGRFTSMNPLGGGVRPFRSAFVAQRPPRDKSSVSGLREQASTQRRCSTRIRLPQAPHSEHKQRLGLSICALGRGAQQN